jgi:nucleotide-binding universal stress UspA family protein
MSQSAFAHALALGAIRQTRLTLLHVSSGKPSDDVWMSFPPVRTTLEQWGMLEPGSPRAAVFEELKLRVQKTAVDAANPMHGILGFLERHPTDLMVLATRGLDGLPRFLQGSTAEPVARRSKTMTLFVPAGCRGFVSPVDGSTRMRSILVPVDHRPDPADAVYMAARAALLGDTITDVSLLHVGSGSPPYTSLPENPAWEWRQLQREGDAVDEILAEAEQTHADLIVTVTEGHQGILDALRGSTTERIVRGAPCPVLAVPSGWVGKAEMKEALKA